jgi:hypothetical protein
MLIRLREGSRSRHAVRAPSPGELKGNFLFERSTTLLTAFASRVVSGVRSVAHDRVRLDQPWADQDPHPLVFWRFVVRVRFWRV